LNEAGGVRAREVEDSELAGWLPLLAPPDAPVVVDEDGGVIHARATIDALTEAVRDSLVVDEVLSVRLTGSGVEVRSGGLHAEYERVVLCAGRGTVALARGAGLPLPVRQAAHARLTYRVRGEPPIRLACLLDAGGAYGDPLPGNAAYAVGLGETAVHEDGSLVDPAELATLAKRTSAYVAEALPGLDPDPVDVRHCWVTELPWSPDGIAVWEHGALLAVAGNNLFKHAPALGRALALAALGDDLAPHLRPEAKLGAERA
jgi:sarcosine oxidase